MNEDQLLPELGDKEIVAVYDELRHIAGALLRGRTPPAEISRPTALVIRWIEKLNANNGWTFKDLASHRGDVVKMAGISMRRLLINLWENQRRREQAIGRPVCFEAVVIHDDDTQRAVPILDLERFHRVMEEMHEEEPLLARVAEQVLFLGLKQSEIALRHQTTTKTIEHQWASAKDWLRDRLPRDKE